MRWLGLCLLGLLAIFLFLPSPVMSKTNPSNTVTKVQLGTEWTKFEPAGETVCALGTPYAYWARQGATDKLLVYFEPGGGCWSADTCAPVSGFYKSTVTDANSPERQSGIFDLDNPSNPFKDYSMVYVSYCTGDVHMGSHTQIYTQTDGDSLTVHHNGFINSSVVMEWMVSQFENPESIFVTGCSAGSVGSAFFAPRIIEAYPDAQVAQLGDSLSFTYHRPLDLQTDYHAHDNFPNWIPALQAIEPGQFTMAHFYKAIANHYPDVIFSEYNTQRDRVQVRFYTAVGGNPDNYERDFEAQLAEIHAGASNFRSFTVGGDVHCILPTANFYRYAIDGISFRDWIADLATGNTVESLHCDDCSVAESLQ